MFGTDPSSNDDPVLREAAQWLARADLGTLDEAAFERWRADPRHALAYLRVVDAARRTADAATTEAVRPSKRRPDVTRRSAIALGLGGLSLAGGALVAGRVTARDRASTLVGATRTIDLPRAGALILNTDSAASWRVGRQGLNLWLERGEIALDLGAQARPVRLTAGPAGARLSPGRYNARLRDGLLDLTILRGEARAISAAASDGAGVRGPHVMVLTSERSLVRSLSSQDLAAVAAWRSGEILFADATLAGAVEEYNRHLRRKIVIADPALSDLRVGGRFTADDPTAFLRALELTQGVEVTGSGQNLILSRKSL